MVWIICSDDFKIRKVEANYSSAYKRWTYWIVNKDGHKKRWDSLAPYNPTLGYGNRSYWGDGYHYRTRKSALEDRATIISKEKKLFLQDVKRIKEEGLKKLEDVLHSKTE